MSMQINAQAVRAQWLRRGRGADMLKAGLRKQLEGTGLPPFFKASDHGLKQDSTARVERNRSVFDDLKLDSFEGNAKHQWIDEPNGICHLCNEPFGTSLGVHLSDRDHVNLGAFLWLYSQYPRGSPAEAVVRDAFDRAPGVAAVAAGPTLWQDHLHTQSDAVRRAELEGILLHLTAGPNAALHYALQGGASNSLWVSGERIFKVNLSRLVAMMLPPMAPGVHSAVTQKCWGRSNQERAYEALNIPRIHRMYGVEPKQGRESCAFFMRTLIWEIHTAIENREVTDVARHLLEEALRRLSFELVYLQSMYYMNRVQDVARRMGGCPTLEELHRLNSL